MASPIVSSSLSLATKPGRFSLLFLSCRLATDLPAVIGVHSAEFELLVASAALVAGLLPEELSLFWAAQLALHYCTY